MRTVDAIIQAAATVLVEGGYDRMSTNRVAEVAGVSIGSLYQYFPSKEAVLRALVERHEERMLEVMRAHLADVAGRDVPTLVRALIESLIEAQRAEPEVEKALLEQMLIASGGGAVDALMESLVRSALESRRDELDVEDLEVAAFLLMTAVRTACHRAVVERPQLLERPSFVDELTELVVRYVLPAAGKVKRGRNARLDT
ncbi:MAG: TetR/AcrR family transcriptional regulator [Polyangiaceae bacterium]